MFVKISEQPSLYNDLEKKSVREILEDINTEDQKVALAVQRAIPQIEKLVTQIVPRMKQGGRIFYMGAGTSGRLGVLDASEIPPTFGMPPTLVIGLIAGGDTDCAPHETRRTHLLHGCGYQWTSGRTRRFGNSTYFRHAPYAGHRLDCRW